VLALLALALTLTDALTRVDNLLYDAALRLMPRAPATDVVIVAIDDASLAELGRWPWSRRVHARLLERLQSYEARAVALDVIFAEPEREDADADGALAAAIAAYGRVVLPVYPINDTGTGPLRESHPLPALEQAAVLGHVDAVLDDDAVTRRIFLRAGVARPRWRTLALALAEVGAGVDRDSPATVAAGRDAIGRWVRNGEMLIPFGGPAGQVPQISYAAVLRDPAVAALIRNRYVLVGATAAGLRHDYATPVTLDGRQALAYARSRYYTERIGRELELLAAMRLQPEGPPDAGHRGVAEADLLGHAAVFRGVLALDHVPHAAQAETANTGPLPLGGADEAAVELDLERPGRLGFAGFAGRHDLD
jgi:CHASE2 domain-containing sensor protein